MLPAGRACSQRRCRWGALILTGALAATALSHNAEARTRHHHYRHHRTHTASRYEPPYASIVVDANSGKVLEATNAESPRHPASLTKMMTLYLLFERLEAGKIKLTTEMPVSEHAASMAPSKLGLKPGEHIDVGTAIRAIVTKSANDVAVTIAEELGGSEPAFAKLMNAKARELGMMHTFYHNASGLPDDAQITTAHDMSILGRALHDRFPQYYHYFSTRYFAWRGKEMRNHDHLLGRISGVDGIKTGYIHESGFNIVTSVARNGRHIIVVVFGGRTARWRDARDESLIADNIGAASTKRTAPPVVEGWENAVARAEKAKHEEHRLASATPLPPAPGSTAPIKPNPVTTFTVEPAPVHAAMLPPLPPSSRTLTPAPASAKTANITTLSTVPRDPPPPAPAAAAKTTKLAAAGAAVPLPVTAPEPAAKQRGGWMIQVGAFDVEKDAKERLTLAQTKAKAQLDKASPFTEPVAKGDKTFYRARFAGLEKAQAETACKHLKRSDIPCMMLRN
jgi:D-alanyl-D-alanine carboxypeptidase